jgi:hypothetical protein
MRPSRLRGGVVAVIGYLLSPLSWWNDLFVNVPLAYLFASLASLVSGRLFAPGMIVGYWLTNIIGLFMLHRGGSELLAQPGSPSRRKRIWIDVAIGTGYTALIAVLAFSGILKPPPQLLRRRPPTPDPGSPAALLHFAREEVLMHIQPGAVEITGMYHFTNSLPNPSTAVIYYPFPLDSIHEWPDSVSIPGYEFERGDSGVSFRMRFRPQTEDSFLAYYRQPLHGREARYIVTTTQVWKRAIDRAQFRITVPADFKNVRLNYKPNAVDRTDSTVIYSFARRRFFPDKDVIVTWKSDVRDDMR